MNTSGPRIHIDLDKYQPKRICQQKYWIKDLGLLEEDRRILLDPYEELTDTIIDASQQLLKKCFPHVSGFQSVCCGLTMNFAVECGEFVQVLHNGRKHWLTVSTLGTRHPIVHVYDSMYALASTTTKAQVAALLHSTLPSIQLSFMSVQMQSGGTDCGVFAIAFATSFALGKPPGQFHFDQQKMRQHLFNCLELRKIERFPYSKLRQATESSVKASETSEVHCVCRMPVLDKDELDWIQCSGCQKWFHLETCVHATKQQLLTKAPWFCPCCAYLDYSA